ncbi:MAG: transposase [Oscillospiraceae bacterium]|nr:transposase [Oscillospiraceae bacterium]
MKRYELTKGQWSAYKELLPLERAGKRGRPRKDDRKMLNGMLWIAHSGARWRELPEAYGITTQHITIYYNCIGTFSVPDRRKIPAAEITMGTRKGVAVSYSPERIAV